tara:strand:+ start:674 stop:847 length:174 start_codon:yes stop_codon:yes gene_type:complete
MVFYWCGISEYKYPSIRCTSAVDGFISYDFLIENADKKITAIMSKMLVFFMVSILFS